MSNQSVKYFRNNPDLFSEFKTRLFTQLILVMIVFLPFFLYLQYRNDLTKKSTIVPKTEPFVFVVIGIVIFSLFIYKLFRSSEVLKIKFNSLRLCLNESYITFEQKKQKSTQIYFDDITKIKIYEDNEVIIFANNKSKIITGKYLNDYDDFIHRITANSKPITRKKTPFSEKHNLICSFVFTFSFIFLLYSFATNKDILISSIALSLFELVCFLGLAEIILHRDRSHKSHIFMIYYIAIMLLFGITGILSLQNFI